MRGARARGARARIIRIGQLGRPAAGRSGGCGNDGNDRRPAGVTPDARAQRSEWERRYGRPWVAGLEALSRWAVEVGIPLRAGSRSLAESGLARHWGWSLGREIGWTFEGWGGGGLPESTTTLRPEERPSRPTWILRTAPGWGERVRQRMDRDGRLDACGARPHLVVEESSRAFLPPEPRSARWPRPDAWVRAGKLLGLAGDDPLIPTDLEDLVDRLVTGGRGRHPLEAEQATLEAWDLWCAASAWELDRAAWWLVRHADGFVSPEDERQWHLRAADWGVCVLPARVTTSRVCACREGHAVRLGLSGVSARVRSVAPDLVLERERGGSFGGAGEFVRRGRRCGLGAAVLAELVVSGALAGLAMDSRVAGAERPAARGLRVAIGARWKMA